MESSNSAEAVWSRRVLGYNHMVLDGRDEFPCELESPERRPEPESPPPCPEWSVPSVTPGGALEALRKYVSERSLDPTAAREATVTHIEDIVLYRFRLETFTERRFTCWNTEPYNEEEQDQPEPPPPDAPPLPPPWDVPMEDPPPFIVSSKDLPLPHTRKIMKCRSCNGRGILRCDCRNGKRDCYYCDGDGFKTQLRYDSYTRFSYVQRQMCVTCSGEGRKRCSFCKGEADVECSVCLGQKKTMVSVSLSVRWSNNPDQELCGEDSGLDLLRYLPGRVLLTHTAPRVSPITDFPEPSVLRASQTLVQKHEQEQDDNTKILKQVKL
ncbi:unnamed protein product [Knipowitschia caucasica]